MTSQQPVTVGVGPLSFADVLAVARDGAPVELGADAVAAIGRARQSVEVLAAAATPSYGISTGFGALATRHIPTEMRAQLQKSLVRSHAAGSGPEVEREVTRGADAAAAVHARHRAHRHPAADRADDGRDAQPRHHPGRPRVRLAGLLGRPRAAVALRAGADGGGRGRRRRTAYGVPPPSR